MNAYSGVLHEPFATRALLPGEGLHLLRVQLLLYQSTLHFDGGQHAQGFSAMSMLDVSFFLFVVTFFFACDCRGMGASGSSFHGETARLVFSTLVGGEEGDCELKAEDGGEGDSMTVFPAVMANATTTAAGGWTVFTYVLLALSTSSGLRVSGPLRVTVSPGKSSLLTCSSSSSLSVLPPSPSSSSAASETSDSSSEFSEGDTAF